MSSDLDYLVELKEYIENNSNLEIDIIRYKQNMIYIEYFKDIINYIFIIIILTLIYYLFGRNIFFLILFFLFLYIILYIIALFYFRKNSLNNEPFHMNFKTGDILQEKSSFNLYRSSYFVILPYIFNIDYFHNLIVIKFKDRHFALHCMSNFNYPEPIYKLKIKNSNIEIICLDSYIDSIKNDFNTNEFRLFKTENNIKMGDILKGLESLNITNMKFLTFPFFPLNKDDIINRNQFNCCSFILKLLHKLNIIPLINYHNFTPNDYVLLPELSNNFYKEPVNIIYK